VNLPYLLTSVCDMRPKLLLSTTLNDHLAFSALTLLSGWQEGEVSGSRCRFANDTADATATHYLLLQ